ncbi:vitamin B12-dependent ribonucleotide reductase [Desulfurivibrio alkaliphilus]|uniref:Vitamin B12-dependent ribonucleotide reductase n=1 Tax=Desulfurivibrio alkaliphilus (strain DSM 19089 / UNIQEM U267 / AHT2) TaxID=589865 RepID=D6Z6S1_DESAT|nr:vitamin B12-dependent ribonucleotide reductase [Desulfurivibrio alkaliphilus]ADH85030.1 ribonucleoside-diphosphate reductase, adenosylcobalamin-dependent [Desulfurivibrio alkaliphilus AHT 2]
MLEKASIKTAKMPAGLIKPKFSANAMTVLKRRYLKKDEQGKVLESPQRMLWRVASTIANSERLYDATADTEALAMEFYRLMAELDFMPNSPTLMNAGRKLGQLSACFVLPIEDSMPSIFEAVKQTALIHQSGGGTGFSFSRIRPKNDVVHSTKGISSGPLSFMSVFDCATETIKQGGTRRGANMAILRVDHPDIMDFIKVKSDLDVLHNFNLSVAITDEFMRALAENGDYALINPRNGEIVRYQNAAKLFRQIVKQAWLSGEPGVVFIDRINAENPTPEAGEIESTNPCGEQPLLPYESCNLGSINLANMVKDGKLDYERLGYCVDTAVHFLDNVVDINNYPLPEIEQVTKQNRKIGLGVMGFADLLVQLEIPYSSQEAVELAEALMRFIDERALKASIALGKSRGAFPNFPDSIYGRQDPKTPVRNATRTTIAPTGTISILAGCSSGVEPLFAVAFLRRVMDNDELFEVNPRFEKIAKEEGFYSHELVKQIAHNGTLAGLEEIPAKYRRIFETAHDITPENHIAIQASFQRHTNNAVSKTINFPHQATEEEVRQAYLLAYELNCKGMTIYRDGCRENQVLNIGKTDKKAAAAVPVLPQKPFKRDRPAMLTGCTYQMSTGCGPMYVTINQDEDKHLFELFNTVGKAGGCAASQCEAIGRLVSLAWRSGMPPEPMIKQLIGISCHKPAGFGENKVTSCADAIAQAIRQHLEKTNGHRDQSLDEVNHLFGACPECGGVIEHEGGCCVCHACGYSECG